MSKPELPGDPWRYATWEGSEIAGLLEGHQMSLAEKFAWLEEMTEVVANLSKTSPGRDAGNKRPVDLDRPEP